MIRFAGLIALILAGACREVREITVAPPMMTPSTQTNDTPTDGGVIQKQDARAPSLDAGQIFDDAGDDPDAGSINCSFVRAEPTGHLNPNWALNNTDWQQLLDCVQQFPSSSTDFVNAFWTAHTERGGAPIWIENEALILFRGNAESLFVSGSFDQWPSDTARPFLQVGQTDLYFVQVPLQKSQRYQYKFLRKVSLSELEWQTDPNNRWVVWDGFDQGGLGNFNNEIIGPEHTFETSLLFRYERDGRNMFLQLPMAYLQGESIEAALYLNDGNEYLTRAGLQTVVDETIAARRAVPLLVAYIALADQNLRISEYTYGSGNRGDEYVTKLATDYVPAIEQLLGLNLLNGARGIGGASLGGLISFHAAWRYNQVFQLIGAQSASLWFDDNEMIARFQNGPNINASVYLDSGSPADNSEATRAMVTVLENQGYPYLHNEEAGAQHDWQFWETRFDELLEFLY